VTVVGAAPFAGESEARDWLRSAGTADNGEEQVERALQSLNRMLRAQRIAAGDPYVHEVSRARAVAVRLGYGAGDALVEGKWSEAILMPPPSRPRGRRRVLEPQQQVAAILGGRRPAMPSEDLLLRARLDLDHGRRCEAALQAHAAGRALAAELDRSREHTSPGWLGDARRWLAEGSAALGAFAEAAIAGGLDDMQATQLGEAVAGMERIARRRRHAADG
jgi:hypothetical protein